MNGEELPDERFYVRRIEVGKWSAVWYVVWKGRKRTMTTTAERGEQGLKALKAKESIV